MKLTNRSIFIAIIVTACTLPRFISTSYYIITPNYSAIFPCSSQFVVSTVIKHTQSSDYIFCYQVKYDDKRLERAISLIQKSD